MVTAWQWDSYYELYKNKGKNKEVRLAVISADMRTIYRLTLGGRRPYMA